MASVERTAYPRFKRSPLAKELDALYTPTDEELSFALKFARRPQFRFGLLVLLTSDRDLRPSAVMLSWRFLLLCYFRGWWSQQNPAHHCMGVPNLVSAISSG